MKKYNSSLSSKTIVAIFILSIIALSSTLLIDDVNAAIDVPDGGSISTEILNDDELNLADGGTYDAGSNTFPITITNTMDKTINGNGATINATNNNQIFTVAGNLTLKDLIITGTDLTTNNGGAIRVQSGGILNLINCTFLNNIAGDGGAIYNQGTTTIENCTFKDNSASDSPFTQRRGGAIYNAGNLDITGTNFINNSANGYGILSVAGAFGGAIYNNNGNVNITDCLFDDNKVTGASTMNSHGGAIYTTGSNANIKIVNSNFTNNSANDRSSGRGGAILIDGGIVNIDGSTFIGNDAYNSGGAISNGDGSGAFGTLNITGSSFISNTVTNGYSETLGTGNTHGGSAIYSANAGRTSISDSIIFNNTLVRNRFAGVNNNNFNASNNFWGNNTGPGSNANAGVTVRNFYQAYINVTTPNYTKGVGDYFDYHFYMQLNTDPTDFGADLPEFMYRLTKNGVFEGNFSSKDTAVRSTQVVAYVNNLTAYFIPIDTALPDVLTSAVYRTNFNLTKVNAEVIPNPDNIYGGQTIIRGNVTQVIDDSLVKEGYVNITVNGREYQIYINTTTGQFELIINNTFVGTENVPINYYNASTLFGRNSTTVALTLVPKPVTIDADDITGEYGTSFNITGKVNMTSFQDAVEVLLTLPNGTVLKAYTDANGNFRFYNIPGDFVNDRTFKLEINDTNYTASPKLVTATLAPKPVTIDANDVTGIYGSNNAITGQVKDLLSGETVTVKLTLPNGTVLTTQTDAMGNFKFDDIPANFIGSKNFTLEIDSPFYTASQFIVDYTVNPADLTITMDKPIYSGNQNEYVTLKATVTGLQYGEEIDVEFYVDGQFVGTSTTVNGVATFRYLITNPEGNVDVFAKTAETIAPGDSAKYNGNSSSTSVLSVTIDPDYPDDDDSDSDNNSNNNQYSNAYASMDDTGIPIVAILLSLLSLFGLVAYRKVE